MTPTKALHITALYLDSDESEDFLKLNRMDIRRLIADLLCYPREEAAFFARSFQDDEADNFYLIEFVIEAGLELVGQASELSEVIRDALLENFNYLEEIEHFGVLIRLAEVGFSSYEKDVKTA